MQYNITSEHALLAPAQMFHKPRKPILLGLVQVLCTEGDTVKHVSEQI